MNSIGEMLRKEEQSVAIAESVTGGLLQFAFSSAEEAKDFFQGGITAYNLGQKVRHLNLDPIRGEKTDCVSSSTAVVIATSCSESFISDWGIGVTGYASPYPERSVEKIFAFFAIVYKGKKICCEKIVPPDGIDPETAKYFYVNQVIAMFENILKNNHAPLK